MKTLPDTDGAEDANQDRIESRSRVPRRLWFVSIAISLVCLIAVGATLLHIYTAPTTPDPADTVVTTPAEVTQYLAAHVPTPPPGAGAPVFIPTGLYIESIEFDGPYTVNISGQIWQRYANDLPKGITKGIFMPAAQEQPTLKEVYREQRANEELIGWTFHVTLREQFDYSRYPMGRHQIRLRMWHPDYDRNVYLTPDLGSYASIDPTSLPGVDPVLILETWDIQEAFFSYRVHDANTDFGTSSYSGDQSHPELYYSIAVRRHLLSPLISRAVVPTVILIQLFVLVMVLGRDDKRLENFGVRPGTVIFTGAGFFFAILIGHNSLRDEVKANGFIYIESLYIITYLVIVAVVCNSVLLVARPDHRLFREHDNMWVKVLYWPVILSSLLAITILMF